MTSETDNTSLHGQGRTTAVSQHQTVSPFLAVPYIKVTAEGVLKLLKKLISNEANGPVILPARILKELAIGILPFLAIIYQKSP